MAQLKDLMTKKLITIQEGANLSEAYEVMQEHRIRHLPVVNSQNDIIGILSSKDLPSFPQIKDINIEFYMTTPIEFVNVELPLKSAVFKMLEKKISCLILTDDKENVAGIITTDDLLWYLVTELDKPSKERSLTQSILDAETIGKVAHQISLTGI